MNDTPHEIHNRDTGTIIKSIIRPTLEAGGGMTEVMVMLESVTAGVLMAMIRLTSDPDDADLDDAVLDVLMKGVRERMADVRSHKKAMGGTSTPDRHTTG